MAIDALLTEIDSWFNETNLSQSRSKLLSKLAILELCGWIEQRFDEIAQNTAKTCGLDSNKRLVKAFETTYGFDYEDHFRGMLVEVVGERGVAAAEVRLESNSPGELAQIKSALGSLRTIRGVLAHTSSAGSVKKQVTVQAPSWVINQQRVLAKRFDRYEAILTTVVTSIHSAL